MSFVNPGYLGDKTAFARTWRTPIEKRGDGSRARALARRVRPFMLRRTKQAVAGELPSKTEMIEAVILEANSAISTIPSACPCTKKCAMPLPPGASPRVTSSFWKPC